MEALMMLAILVFMIMTMFVINLVSTSPRGHESRSQKQGFFSADTLFYIDLTPDIIGKVIEGIGEVGIAIIEGVGSVLEVIIDVFDW